MTPNNNNEPAYSYSLGYDNVGNTKSLTDSIVGGWTYGYDTLNRLVTTGQASGGPYAGQYGCWTYDAFGNRTAEVFQTSPCSSVAATATYNGNNQVTWTTVHSATSGFSYDAAGNVADDRLHTYLYDGLGRICAVQGDLNRGQMFGYIYDAEGNRIQKGTLSSWPSDCPGPAQITLTTQYAIGLGGEQISEFDGAGNWIHSNVFAGGALLATYANGDTDFDLTDWQGTKRAQSSVVGCLTGWASLPYGNGTPTFGDPTAVSIGPTPECGADATEHHYTGKEHDFETSNDDFGARYFEDVTGRWLSPDWAAAAEAVPYASYGSPQTLNLYAFVGNNPLSQVDADGHQFYRVSCSGGTAGQCGVGAYPGSEGIFSNEGMGPGMGCDAEGGEHCAPNMQESFYNSWLSTAQQQNGNQSQSGQQSSSSSSSTPQSKREKIEAEQRAAMLKTLTAKLCASGDAGCGSDIDSRLVLATQIGKNGLKGGNWNFELLGENGQSDLIQTSGCLSGRCGLSPSLHVHADGTMHLDTMNSYSLMGVGAIVHLFVDVIGGNTWWAGGIPR